MNDPTPSPSAPESSTRARSSVGSVLVHAALALLVALVASVVVGARGMAAMGADLDPDVGKWVALVSALLVVVALPLAVAAKFFGRVVTSLRASVVWSICLAVFLIVAMPTSTRASLAAHGGWPAALLGQDPEPLRATVDSLAGWIPRADPPSWPSGAATDAGTPLTVTGPDAGVVVRGPLDGGESDVSEVANAPVAPPEVPPTDAPPTAAELFRRAAPSTVVVPVRTSTDGDAPQSKAMKAFGLSHVAGHGSGFFVSDDGLFVTNFHVLGRAGQAMVRLHDGRELTPVTVLARDESNDLVLAKVDVTGVIPVQLADAEPNIGDPVVAIGSPRGLDFTMTRGIVSAVRMREETRMIQIDATIAPGSSGGPLFAGDGALLGVNTETRGAGLNIAVHVSHVRALLKLPRQEDVLERYAEGLRLKKLSATGVKLLPTTRGNAERFLDLLAQSVDGCLATHPPQGAEPLVVTLRLGKGGLFARPVVSSSVGAAFDKCVGDGGMATVIGSQLKAALDGKFDAMSRVTVVFEGAPGPGHLSRSERTLLLQVVAHNWTDPKVVADDGETGEAP